MTNWSFFGRSPRQRGFSLVEVLIGVAVFLIISVSLYGSLATLLRSSTTSRARVAGIALANERLEVIRNLAYDAVGTTTGLPRGNIPSVQTFTRDGIPFTVRTTVRDVDDPFDGTIGGTPNDASPADYKAVTVRVECPTCLDPFPPVELTSSISKGRETASGNGALFVQVFDASGNPVEAATVDVQRTLGAAFSVQDVTDVTGFVRLFDVPPGTDAYRISVSASGYSTDRTYPPGAAGNPNPVKPDATVAAGQATQVSFAIDRTGTVAVSTLSPTTCTAVPDVALHAYGAKLIGTNPNVLKYEADVTTNSQGTLSLSPLEWDTYAFRITDVRYDLAGALLIQPLTLAPGGTENVSLLARPAEPESILVSVRDAGTHAAINGATVQVVEANQTKLTGEGTPACAPPGQAFFFGLPAQTVTVNITAGGYQPFQGTVDVTGESFLDVPLSP